MHIYVLSKAKLRLGGLKVPPPPPPPPPAPFHTPHLRIRLNVSVCGLTRTALPVNSRKHSRA